ncbi:hypothetical protein [Nocardiopsis oceani]
MLVGTFRILVHEHAGGHDVLADQLREGLGKRVQVTLGVLVQLVVAGLVGQRRRDVRGIPVLTRRTAVVAAIVALEVAATATPLVTAAVASTLTVTLSLVSTTAVITTATAAAVITAEVTATTAIAAAVVPTVPVTTAVTPAVPATIVATVSLPTPAAVITAEVAAALMGSVVAGTPVARPGAGLVTMPSTVRLTGAVTAVVVSSGVLAVSRSAVVSHPTRPSTLKSAAT